MARGRQVTIVETYVAPLRAALCETWGVVWDGNASRSLAPGESCAAAAAEIDHRRRAPAPPRARRLERRTWITIWHIRTRRAAQHVPGGAADSPRPAAPGRRWPPGALFPTPPLYPSAASAAEMAQREAKGAWEADGAGGAEEAAGELFSEAAEAFRPLGAERAVGAAAGGGKPGGPGDGAGQTQGPGGGAAAAAAAAAGEQAEEATRLPRCGNGSKACGALPSDADAAQDPVAAAARLAEWLACLGAAPAAADAAREGVPPSAPRRRCRPCAGSTRETDTFNVPLSATPRLAA